MRMRRDVVGGSLVAALILSLLLVTSCRGAAQPGPAQSAKEQAAWKFDCGPAGSPVMAGFKALSPEDSYDPSRGYGWETKNVGGTLFQGIVDGVNYLSTQKRARTWEIGNVEENLNDLNRDAVVSEDDLVFRADVPNGTYRVTVTIGDMSQPIGSMDVYINGERVAERVAAWSPGGYRMILEMALGWWVDVRDTVKVDDGKIRVALKKDQTYFDQQMAEQITWESPYTAWRPGAAGYPDKPPYFYIGYKFVHNSIMGIQIFPDVPPPVVAEDDSLRLTREVSSLALAEAISDFNRGGFAEALKALGRVREPEAQVAKAVVQLWLAGRLEVESEDALVPAAVETLSSYAAAHPGENGIAELLEDAKVFQKALTIHLTRGELSKNHFIENDKAIGWWWLIRKGSPLYYKSQLYIARAAHMLLPYVPTLGTEEQILKEVEKKFPDNRYVKYLLHWEWAPYGDGAHFQDWRMVDYMSKSEGAPEWARQLQAAWATLLDWCEWWVKFKQHPEGNIGGGWGDDVEIVGAFGYMAFVSKGSSEISLEGTRRLVEGVWNLSEVDPDLGYCLPMADAEHTAEWTGNTLGMMVQIDYGNPVWIERSLKTAKLMRDLWTGIDNSGNRHFRANFFGAAQVGSGDQANDSWINYRAVRPAAAVLSYSQHPTISKLFVELADGWLAAAMSTDWGKPAGVIPAQVSFPEGILGGTNSPNWWTASHRPNTVNYDWRDQDYKDYLQELLLTAYVHTRDPKYLEPLRLEYELAAKYGNLPKATTVPRLGTPPWDRPSKDTRDGLNIVLQRWQPIPMEEKPAEAAPPAAGERAPEVTAATKESAEPGSESWVAGNLKGTEKWLYAKRAIEGRKGPLEDDINRLQIVNDVSYFNAMVKVRWPLMTTEASATDRAAFAGFPDPFFIYTGGRMGGPLLEAAVTYEGGSRDFAAAVLASDAQGFRILYYSMAPQAREVGIVPWDLEPGGKYVVRYGPDSNEDERMDSVEGQKDFTYAQRGTPVRLVLEPKVTYVIEAEEVERGRGAEPAPDPGLSERDIQYVPERGLILVKVHNVGSKAVRRVQVECYDGDPEAGGTLIGSAVIPNMEASLDLDPKAVTVGFNWAPPKESHEIYVVVDPKNDIEEITTFNNVAHATLPKEEQAKVEAPKPAPAGSFRAGGRG